MLIIFDFDGVLISAHWKGLYNAYKALIIADGKNHKDFFKNISEFKKWWTPDWRRNLECLKIDDEEKAHKIFYEVSNSHIHIFDWVGPIIGELYPKHWLALLTNRHKKNAEELLGSLAIFFHPIVGGDNVKNLKPDPEGINLILAKLGVKREEALMIGDTAVDILAGKAAGVKTGAVRWGLGSWKELISLKPDYLFKKGNDLLKL